jgi:hypothetical protein
MSYSANQVQILLSEIQDKQNDPGYQQQIMNNYKQLLETVKTQNKTINSTYNNTTTQQSANGQQTKYVFQSSAILNKLYNYTFWIYFVLAVILCFIVMRKSFHIIYKIILVFAILGYPFYIYALEKLSYVISVYVWDVLLSVVYDNGYNNVSLEYGLSPTKEPPERKNDSYDYQQDVPEGTDGPQGTDGPDEPQGTDGPDEPQGTDGPDEPEGTDGPEAPN